MHRIGFLVLAGSFMASLGCGGSDSAGTDAAASDGPPADAGNLDKAAAETADGGPGDTGGGSDAASDPGGEGKPSDTWTSFGRAFFETYCTSCHKAGGSAVKGGALDFVMYDKVKAAAAKIRCGTAPSMQSGCGASPKAKMFPVGTGPKPGDAERQRLVDWIDAGLPM